VKREYKEEEREAFVECRWLKGSYILSEGPYLHAKEPHILTKEHYVSVK